MNWSEYKAKKGKTADFAKKKQTMREAVEEVKDSDGNVTTKAEPKVERDYVAMVQKTWNPSTGEKLDDHEREWSLSELESEKKMYDNDIARAKEQSDGLAEAIADFKKL
jgi:hypothetical protein